MTFSYDTVADALDISIRPGVAVARTEELDTGTLVDVDRKGRVIAIEVIRPARRWPLGEILERYEIAPEDADVLRALWREPEMLPFASRADVGSTAVGA